MKNRFIRRLGILFLLLLVMYQQVGAGLYIHNLFHASSEKQSHEQHHETSREIKFACSCVDNFLTPAVETDEVSIALPGIFHLPLNDFYKETTYFLPLNRPSLRGPPAFIA